MDQKRIDEIANEGYAPGQPANLPYCKNCAFKDVVVHPDTGKLLDRHENPNCGKYPHKPKDVYWYAAPCALYEPEAATPDPPKNLSDAPLSVDNGPLSVDSAPESVDSAPESVDSAPESVDSTPESVDSAPESVDSTP